MAYWPRDSSQALCAPRKTDIRPGLAPIILNYTLILVVICDVTDYCLACLDHSRILLYTIAMHAALPIL